MAVAPRPGIRLDKWLWHARFCKSRSIAQRLVEEGALRVNGVRGAKPSTNVHMGDSIVFAQGGRVRAVRILALGERRGPATEAQALYVEIDAMQQAGGLEPRPEPDT